MLAMDVFEVADVAATIANTVRTQVVLAVGAVADELIDNLNGRVPTSLLVSP